MRARYGDDVETVSRMLDLSVHCAGGVGDHLHRSSYADTYAIQSQQGRLVVEPPMLGRSALGAWRLLRASRLSNRATDSRAKKTRLAERKSHGQSKFSID